MTRLPRMSMPDLVALDDGGVLIEDDAQAEIAFLRVSDRGQLLARWTIPLHDADSVYGHFAPPVPGRASRDFIVDTNGAFSVGSAQVTAIPSDACLVAHGCDELETSRTRIVVDPVLGPVSASPATDDLRFRNGDHLAVTARAVHRVSAGGVVRWTTGLPTISVGHATILDDRVYLSSYRHESHCWACRRTADLLGVQVLGPHGQPLASCGHVGVTGEVAALFGDLVVVDDYASPLATFRCVDGVASVLRTLIEARGVRVLGAAVQGGEVHAVFHVPRRAELGPLVPGIHAARVGDTLGRVTLLDLDDSRGVPDPDAAVVFLDDGGVVLLARCSDGPRSHCLRRVYPRW